MNKVSVDFSHMFSSLVGILFVYSNCLVSFGYVKPVSSFCVFGNLAKNHKHKHASKRQITVKMHFEIAPTLEDICFLTKQNRTQIKSVTPEGTKLNTDQQICDLLTSTKYHFLGLSSYEKAFYLFRFFACQLKP